MSRMQLAAAVVLCAVAWGQDQLVRLPAAGQVETVVTLSAQDLQLEPMLWIESDPNFVEVTIVSPAGEGWTQADGIAGPVTVRLADEKSAASDERDLAKLLGAGGTLVSWSKSAPAGSYRVVLAGSASGPLRLHRSTAGQFTRAAKEAEERRAELRRASAQTMPERRIPLKPNGQTEAQISSPLTADDLIVVGTTLGGDFQASVRMPDGSVATEANAEQLGCFWSSVDERSLGFRLLKSVALPHFAIQCPERMLSGPGKASVVVMGQGRSGEMALAVVRQAELEPGTAESDVPEGPVRLRHREENGVTENGYVNATAGKTHSIRVAAEGEGLGTIRIYARMYPSDAADDKPLGSPVALIPEADGAFRYSFQNDREGMYRVEFAGEGLLTNNRRFTAATSVNVFVHPLGGVVTGVRQQRVDTDGDGKADAARFLVDLKVLRAGDCRLTVLPSNARPNPGYPTAQATLQPGTQQVVIETSGSFFKMLEANPRMKLELSLSQHRSGEYASHFESAVAMPRAGEFESVVSTTDQKKALRAGHLDRVPTLPQ